MGSWWNWILASLLASAIWGLVGLSCWLTVKLTGGNFWQLMASGLFVMLFITIRALIARVEREPEG